MTDQFNIHIGVGHLIPAGSPLSTDIFQHLAYAVGRITAHAEAKWKSYAQGEPLPNGRSIGSRSGAYLRSIHTVTITPFSTIVRSASPYASQIERGAPARDMKRMLNTSPKVRVSKKTGRRYLIIPFRWGTPGAVTFGGNVMPLEVHDMWQGMRSSTITKVGWRDSGLHASDVRTRQQMRVRARAYRWGDRAKLEQLREAGASGVMARRMAGMVRMRNTALGMGKHSQYLTFRVMAEGSPGWLAPAREGLWPAKTTADAIRPVAEKAFAEAARRDIQQALGGG